MRQVLHRIWHFMQTVPLGPSYTVLSIVLLISLAGLLGPMVARQQAIASIASTATAIAVTPTLAPTQSWTLVSPFPTSSQPLPTTITLQQVAPNQSVQPPVSTPSAVVPVATPSPAQPPVPIQASPAQASPTPQVVYNFDANGGTLITNPPLDWCNTYPCVTTFWTDTNGYLVQCSDGKYSHSGGVSGACSRNGGVAHILYAH